MGLGNCDNTSDLNKPISTATQTALNLKADKTELPEVPITTVKVNNEPLVPASGAVNITVPTQASDIHALADSVKYAGASTAGGSATSAAKLDTASAGSATQPVYFANGIPTATSYSLEKSVPSNAVFTDTTYESKAAARGGTDVSLCTTGEKYTWNSKQNAIDSSHKLSADLVDDTSTTNKFATAAELEQIQTNKNNISNQQNAIADGGNGYAIINGKRLYMTDTEPTTPRIGDKWLSDTLQTYIQENGAIGTIEQGSFDSRDGTESENATRVRTTFATNINPKGKYTISATGVSDVVIYAYNSNNTSDWNSAASVTQWQPLPYTFDTTTNLYLRFAFRKNSTNPNISPSDISNIVFTCQRWD